MINIAQFRDKIINGCIIVYDKTVDSSVFDFLIEKYAHLNHIQKRILYNVVISIFLLGVFYYPVSRFIFSYQHVRDFTDKTKIIQQLNHLSFALQKSSFSPSLSEANIISFIKRKISFLQIPKTQVIKVQKVKTNKLAGVKTSIQQQDVLIVLDDLNVQEVIQYGYRLENLSPQFKLTGIQVKEDIKKENYFDVSYTLAFFSLSEKNSPTEIIKTPSSRPPSVPNNPITKSKKL